MRHLRILATAGLLAAAGVAQAEVSTTWTLASDYDFRGASQTSTDPAIQGSVDFASQSGWYIGLWGSNVDFGPGVDASYEVDLYTGFSGGAEDGLGWDVGLVYYAYPQDSDLNYPEIYGKLSYGMFTGGLSYSNDWVNSNMSAFYVSGEANVPLPNNFSLLAHAGYSFGDFWSEVDSKYVDWSVGVGYTVGRFNMALKYVDTTLGQNDFWFSSDNVNNTEGRLLFTIATTFPWSKE